MDEIFFGSRALNKLDNGWTSIGRYGNTKMLNLGKELDKDEIESSLEIWNSKKVESDILKLIIACRLKME